jgi:hypothetical protein
VEAGSGKIMRRAKSYNAVDPALLCWWWRAQVGFKTMPPAKPQAKSPGKNPGFAPSEWG